MIIVAVVAGSLPAPTLPDRLATAAAAGVALGLVALVIDARTLPTWTRLSAEFAAGAVALMGGVRAEPTGTAGPDVIFTIIWIVVVCEAIRGLDFTDGLACGVTFMSAAGLFALAAFGGQATTAVLSCALAGACAGFLAYNMRPASVFLRDCGALFLGFALAVVAIEVDPSIHPPGSFVVPLLLVAVPLLDIGLVTLARLRRGAAVLSDRRDHLYHRLTAERLSRRGAIRLLIAAQFVFSVLAVFTGRGVLNVLVAVLIGTAALVVLILTASTMTADRRSRRRVSLRWRTLVVAAFLGLGAIAVTGAVVAVVAHQQLEDGRSTVQAALTAARNGETGTARRHFDAAASNFDRASSLLGSPLTMPGFGVPVLGQNLRAARDVAKVGTDLARAGAHLAASTDAERLKITNGTVPLDEVRRITPNLESGVRTLDKAIADLERISSDRSLVGPVKSAIGHVERELSNEQQEAHNGMAAAKLAPAILGADGPRHYFLAVQNTAELRATGGLIGNFGILSAENGKVHLDSLERISLLTDSNTPISATRRQLDAPADFIRRYGRFDPAHTWQNVNMSPDFPTVARVISSLYPQSGGQPVDGVIAVDPDGLAALLELTGPITVEGWPEPITSENVVDITLHQAYDRFGNDPSRVEFIGDVAHTAMDVATTGDLGSPAHIGKVLGRAARDGHFILSFARPEEQRLAVQFGVAGRVNEPRSDSVLVTTQNAAGNKVDFYLHRQMSYDVTVEPGTSEREARVRGKLQLRLDNGAPATGPRYALGPYDARFAPGENRSFVSVYTPLAFTSARFDGQPTELEVDRELGRNVYSLFTSVYAGTRGTLDVNLAGAVKLERGGWYRLQLPHQPSLAPDEVTVSLKLPSGWKIVDAVGLKRSGPRAAQGQFRLSESRSVAIRVQPARSELDIWQRLVDGR